MLGGKYFDRKANTIRNNVECLHKLDIFFISLYSKKGDISYNINNIKKK